MWCMIFRVARAAGLVLAATAPMLLWTADIAAQSKTTNYKYDALGRLTYVEDPVNGNRDYDYDAAGNRRVVATSTASDAAVEPGSGGPFAPPQKPAGLTSQYMYDCAWAAGWQVPATTTSLIFKSTQNSSQTLPASQVNTTVFCESGMPSSNKPNWIQACNSLGCSEKAYFP
jgi:YD repeat-containing protein